jgi:hypothetical protein
MVAQHRRGVKWSRSAAAAAGYDIAVPPGGRGYHLRCRQRGKRGSCGTCASRPMAEPENRGAQGSDMSQSLRKFVGTVVTALFVLIYALLAMAVAAAVLPGTSGWVQLLYYAVAGLVWVVPIAFLIRWMSRPDDTSA